MGSTLYPLRLEPYLSRPIWGGHRLAERYGKGAGSSGSIGESWEVWEGDRVVNGPLAGRTLMDLTQAFGTALLGRDAPVQQAGRFPLLIKLIDAAQQLSIQVHPNDQQAQALEHQPNGKTEAWYILDAAPDAKLVYGLAHPIGEEELRRHAADGSIEGDLAELPVSPGDVVFVPAGTIHAIGAGILLYEVQQTSETTYRLYDWQRKGPDGKPRELHLDKGVQVANREPAKDGRRQAQDLGRDGGVQRWGLVRCPYFALGRIVLDGAWICRPAGESFRAITCIKGGVQLRSPGRGWSEEYLDEGESILLPASLDEVDVRPLDGQAELLAARLPV